MQRLLSIEQLIAASCKQKIAILRKFPELLIALEIELSERNGQDSGLEEWVDRLLVVLASHLMKPNVLLVTSELIHTLAHLVVVPRNDSHVLSHMLSKMRPHSGKQSEVRVVVQREVREGCTIRLRRKK